MFEAFAIKVLQSASNVKKAAELLKLSWDTAHTIMGRAVERGVERRSEQPIRYIGIGETAEDLGPFDAGEYADALIRGPEKAA